MIKIRRLADAFAYFGAVAANPRWSWSAQSPDGRTVVLTLWEDRIERLGASKVTVDAFGDEVHLWKDKLGNRDRIAKLIHARDKCGGLFRVVFVVAKDIKARPRKIAYRYVDPQLTMKLIELDEQTGEFRAESVE